MRRSTISVCHAFPLVFGALAMTCQIAELGAQQKPQFRSLRAAVNVAGDLFFTADTKANGAELWVLDSGKKAARLVKDIYPGAKSSGIARIIAFEQRSVFVADDGEHGAELWCSDGTRAGTVMIRDLAVGAASAGIDLAKGSVVVGKSLYLFTDDGRSASLWISDGTGNGTTLLKSFPPADDRPLTRGFDHRMTLLPRGIVVFQVRGKGPALQLWRSDGTKKGTHTLTDVPICAGAGRFGRLSDRVFFAGGQPQHVDLWFTDGTRAGTKPLHNVGLPGPPPTRKDRRKAKKQAASYCATCHGVNGKGNGLAAAALKPPPRDWTDRKWQASVTDQRILEIIRDGGAKHGLSPVMAPNPIYARNPGVLKVLVEIVRSYGKSKVKKN